MGSDNAKLSITSDKRWVGVNQKKYGKYTAKDESIHILIKLVLFSHNLSTSTFTIYIERKRYKNFPTKEHEGWETSLNIVGLEFK